MDVRVCCLDERRVEGCIEVLQSVCRILFERLACDDIFLSIAMLVKFN